MLQGFSFNSKLNDSKFWENVEAGPNSNYSIFRTFNGSRYGNVGIEI
jgi:hypothetical protein